MDMAGIVFALYAFAIGRAAWKWNTAGARLAALMSLNLAAWLLIAVADSHAAMQLAGWLSDGVNEDVRGIAALIRGV